MACDPEISRRNGRYSRGAVTERGKAIASRNATKHGLLAQSPPLLVTEDWHTFEGLVQGLVDHYQPASPVEHFLVQQVAMGMLKQHRLWGVEAAIANRQILSVQRSNNFPDLVVPPRLSFSGEDYLETQIPVKQALSQEADLLNRLVGDLDSDLSQLQERRLSLPQALSAFRESLEQNHDKEDHRRKVYQYRDKLTLWLATAYEQARKRKAVDVAAVIARINQLLGLAKERIAEIEQTLLEIQLIDQEIKEAEAFSQGMFKQELLSRYQRGINRELYEALDRLEAIQKQRIAKGSIGSFGQEETS